MRLVIVESPYAGDVLRNEIYAEFACQDCLIQYDEAPYASHLLYTREFVLNDSIPDDRKLGINAGFAWRQVADGTVFYTDLGWSDGMELARNDCIDFTLRVLPEELWAQFVHACGKKGLVIPVRAALHS